MKHQRFFTILLSAVLCSLLLGVPFSSCTSKGEQLETCVDSFAQAYFRWQFLKAVRNCDAESYRWISFVASQVTQADVDSLRERRDDIDCTIGNAHLLNDSMAVVEVDVSHFLRMDSLGRATFVEQKSTYCIPAILRNGFWRVSMREVLRPKKND